MADKNTKINIVESLITGMDHFMSTKTVVGEPTQIGDTIIVPLVDVSFGVGAGMGNGEKGSAGSGGMGAKMTPSAVLIIRDGSSKVINIKNQDAVTKLLDMVPDLVNKLTVPKEDSKEMTTEEAVAIAFPEEDANVE